MHEYYVNGNDRRFIYYYIAIVSLTLSPIVPILINNIQTTFNITISITITSVTVYSMLYFMFDRILWKIPMLGIPNFSGEWRCDGNSYKYNKDEHRTWSGVIRIQQTWNKILITLDTENSKSVSISMNGSIIKLKGRGYKLYYLYSNTPKPDHRELHSHIGHCEILFNNELKAGDAQYFTNQERCSYGSMQLRRVR